VLFDRFLVTRYLSVTRQGNNTGGILIYRVSIKSFPYYKRLLQENYVEYKHIFFSKLNLTQEVILETILTH